MNQFVSLDHLLANLKNLSKEEKWSYLFSDLINVEGGYASFRTEWLKKCDCDWGARALQHDCNKCGKSRENSLYIKAGDGDGIYPVTRIRNERGETIASLTLFDKGRVAAKIVTDKIAEREIVYGEGLSDIFMSDLVGIEIGHLKLNSSRTVYYSDSEAGLDSDMATAWEDNWIGGGITVYGFFEPVTASIYVPGQEKTQENSLRPRLIFLVTDTYKQLHNGLAEKKMSAQEWSNQIELWSKELVVANHTRLGRQAMLWNGLHANVIASYLNENNQDPTGYQWLEFSWYLQGALLGDAACIENAQQMINANPFLGSPDALRHAYTLRGLLAKSKEL